MGSDYPGPHGRKRAIALSAADARTLLNSTFPFVVQTMTPDQIGQVQKVLDAAVVNPAILAEREELMRKSVIGGTGAFVNRDPIMVRRAHQLFEETIAVSEADKRIRLNFTTLLAPDAFAPRTDNPDEADYLTRIRLTLTNKGVWLRFDHQLVRDPSDTAGRWMVDPRTFRAWLSLGPDGDSIPAPDGRLTRDALLGTTVLGANYYRKVVEGNIQSTLKKAIGIVDNKISEGETLHDIEQRARDQAAPFVVPVSDTLGGADFPSKTIWKQPRDLALQARTQNIGGNVLASSETIIVAAITAQGAAQVLDQYIDDTMTGAGRAVKILTVAKVLGKVAETILLLRALITGLVRLLAAEATETTAGTLAAKMAKNRSPGAYYPTNYRGPAAFEKTINQVGATLDTEAGVGTALDRYDIATRKAIEGHHDEILKDIMQKFVTEAKTSVNAAGQEIKYYQAPISELLEFIKKADAKWGNTWAMMP